MRRSDGPAHRRPMNINLSPREIQVFHRHHDDDGEGLIDLEEVHIVAPPADALEKLLDRRDRRRGKSLGAAACVACPKSWRAGRDRETVPPLRLSGPARRSVRNGARIGGGDGSVWVKAGFSFEILRCRPCVAFHQPLPCAFPSLRRCAWRRFQSRRLLRRPRALRGRATRWRSRPARRA